MNEQRAYIDPNNIPSMFPKPHEIYSNAAPTRAAEPLGFSMGSERVASHFFPAANPFDLAAQRVDQQETITLANATVAVFNRDMPPGLPCQILVREAEANSTTMT